MDVPTAGPSSRSSAPPRLQLSADPERLRITAVPPTLTDRNVERVAEEAATARRYQRKPLLLGVAGTAAAIVAAVVLAFGVTGDDGDETLRIELAGVDPVEASAVLTARPWGTEVILDISGLDEGEAYWMWLTDAGGDRVVAGSFTGTGERTRVVLGSALPTDEARRIWMTDEADEVVLDAEISREYGVRSGEASAVANDVCSAS
jgi:hypothetical protein